jgi:hypothetical protein
MAQEVQRVFSRRYSAEGRAQPSLEGLMRSTEQPTETDGDGHGGIRARLDGIADYVGKIAGGILRLPVEVFGGALNLLHLSLHLGLTSPAIRPKPSSIFPPRFLAVPVTRCSSIGILRGLCLPTNDGGRRWFKT